MANQGAYRDSSGAAVVFPPGWGESSTKPFNGTTVVGDTVMVSFELGTTKGNIGFAKVRNYICGSCIVGPPATEEPAFCPQNDPEMPPETHEWQLTELGCVK